MAKGPPLNVHLVLLLRIQISCIFMHFTYQSSFFQLTDFDQQRYFYPTQFTEESEPRDIQDVDKSREPLWLYSGKFQGDIDGVDESIIKQSAKVQFNGLRNRQLIWPNGVIPYELDDAFLPNEVRLLHRAFRIYRRRTCIRFRPHRAEFDFLNIVKGHGCYSQVGRTGGKQEISLGRGCLFNETIIHELMHSLGFWHEHSRADRDEHIIIRWENILPGMDSQFDIVSSAIQDTQGEPYDYRSIMHYGSSAFSRNGRNTLEAVIDEYTNVIGTAIDLSERDVIKISKLYRCRKRDYNRAYGSGRRNKRIRGNPSRIGLIPAEVVPSSTTTDQPTIIEESSSSKLQLHLTLLPHATTKRFPTISATLRPDIENLETQTNDCQDHFLDCPSFREYCKRVSFYFIMRSYCPFTCGICNDNERPRNDRNKVEDISDDQEDT